MNVKEYIKNNITYLDGGMGTLLQNEGLKPGELPEIWNIIHSDKIVKIHRDYFDAGSNIINTNTFGANLLKFSKSDLEEIIRCAVSNARQAQKESIGVQEKFVAFDMGPTGKMLKPYGDLDFEAAVEIFAENVRLAVKYGVDLITIETMNDSYETKAALLAVKENSSLPVFVTNAYSDDGKLMTGASPECMVALLEGMGADAIGINCSFGPDKLADIAKKYIELTSIPVILKPNAGLPKVENGKTVYDIDEEVFADKMAELINCGVRIVGGCCGTTPNYIRTLVNKSKDKKPIEIVEKNSTVVSSFAKTVVFGKEPILIGERINPTGKKRFKQALKENDIGYILNEGINQQDKGVHILDVNVGLPDIDENYMLKTAVCELQTVSDLPLQIDTSDSLAMETALRFYNGKAMINSVNGKEDSMNAIFPLVKKYGGVVVALTLDDNGIPETAQGRIEIAKKILKKADEYGIDKKDIVFDTLAMTVSASSNSALITLEALRYIRNELGCNTSLGISNISFGLPQRDIINSTFFALALENGLSAAIMNPYSVNMMKTYYSYNALHNFDSNCMNYINFASMITTQQSQISLESKLPEASGSELQNAIIKGLKLQSGKITSQLLQSINPLDIVNKEIIPALDIVGEGFEKKTVYLPQLLMSAEAAGSAFEQIKSAMLNFSEDVKPKCSFVIATVKGDIHDIGKNIVKLILENYGFQVCDLGKDVSCEAIVDKVIELHSPLVGLSALMTTTVPSMEQTISLLHKKAPWCKVVVGGAVLNQEYADNIGADKYARDAMETVRYAEEINNMLN